jgi:hypothetical protein
VFIRETGRRLSDQMREDILKRVGGREDMDTRLKREKKEMDKGLVIGWPNLDDDHDDDNDDDYTVIEDFVAS